MRTVPRKDQQEAAKLAQRARDIIEQMNAEIDAFNTRMEHFTELFDAAKAEAYAIADEQTTNAEAYYDERSEAWQEGDAGQAYASWKDDLEALRDEIDGEGVEVDPVAEVDEPGWVSTLIEQEWPLKD